MLFYVCIVVCKEMSFGNNCQDICHCLNGTSCNNIDGQCVLGFKQTKSAHRMRKICNRDKVYLIQPYVIIIVITYGISEIFSGYSMQNVM
jgi:hypothetical protein